MTWVSVAIGVGVGAAAGGIQAGIKGGSVGDILESMTIGGAMGGVGGGIGGAIAGPAGGAAASGAESAATEAATQAVTTPLTESVGPQAIEQFGINSADAVVAPATGATPGWTPAGLTSISADAAPLQSATPLQQGIAQGSQAANPGAFTNPAADELAAAAPGGNPSIYQPMTQEASANLAKQEAMVGSHAGDEGGILQATKTFEPNVPVTESVGTPVPKPNISGYVKQGANWLKDHPKDAMIGGAVLLPLMSGGGGSNNGTPYQPDTNTYLSPNFKRSVPQGYDPAKGYANGGGILSGLPSAGVANQLYNSSIGHDIAPKLGDQLFQNNPKPAAGPMNPIVARAIEAQQQAQGQQQAFQGPNAEQQMQQAAQAQPQQPQVPQVPTQHAANGGILQVDGHLGDYAHGGIPRLLSGAGDGVSDSIPATIAGKEPARLADGEFVVPARIVSELGNGSTEAGGKILQAMVDRVQARRSKTVGKGKVAVNSKARKDLPA